MRRAIAALLDILHLALPVCLMVWIAALGPFCWMMRDGLGPDSVESHGAHAAARFLLSFYWGPVLMALLALMAVCRWQVRSGSSVEAKGSNPREQSRVRAM